MKFTYPFLFLALFLSLGCNEDTFLDRVPPGRYTPTTFFETEEQIAQATTAIYPIMRGFVVNQLYLYGEMRSDNTTFEYDLNDRGRVAVEEIDYFLLQKEAGLHTGIWNGMYTGIARTNYVIAQIGDVPFLDEELKLAREAEARFFRGYFYHQLVLHFGDVVIIDQPLEDDGSSLIGLQRSSVEDVYAQLIVPDLQFAIDNLPDSWPRNEEGRITRGAARMALAKAYFSERDYASALPLLDDLIDSQEYQLLNDYFNVFHTDNNAEIIWSVQWDVSAGQGSGFMLGWLPDSGADITEGPFRNIGGFNIPTCDLIDAYEPGDRRFDLSIGLYEDGKNNPNTDSIYYSTKFLELPFPTQGGIDVDFPIFRYADALLMQAEALVETEGGLPNQVFESLNSLRARAGLGFYFPGNPNPDLDLQTTEALREAIRRERRVELAFENHRSYDLRRYGIWEETMRAHGAVQKEKQAYFLDDFPEAYTEFKELLAIPPQQVELYGYAQNPGWD